MRVPRTSLRHPLETVRCVVTLSSGRNLLFLRLVRLTTMCRVQWFPAEMSTVLLTGLWVW